MLLSGSEAPRLIEGAAASLRKRRDLRNPLDPDLAPRLVTAAIYQQRLCAAPRRLIIPACYEFGGGLRPVNTRCNFLGLVFTSFCLHGCCLEPADLLPGLCCLFLEGNLSVLGVALAKGGRGELKIHISWTPKAFVCFIPPRNLQREEP